MYIDQDQEPRRDEPIGEGPTPMAALPSTPTVGSVRDRRPLRRWLIVAAVVLCLGAAATVLAVTLTGGGPSFASATDLMNALKARGVTCSSETPEPQVGATSSITCDTQAGHHIIVEVYATQTAADTEYDRVIGSVGLQPLGLTEYFATGDRWVVHGDDSASVQLAANAFNGRIRVGTL